MLHADCMRMCIYACISIAASQRICVARAQCVLAHAFFPSAIPYLLYKCAKVPTQHSSFCFLKSLSSTFTHYFIQLKANNNVTVTVANKDGKCRSWRTWQRRKGKDNRKSKVSFVSCWFAVSRWAASSSSA